MPSVNTMQSQRSVNSGLAREYSWWVVCPHGTYPDREVLQAFADAQVGLVAGGGKGSVGNGFGDGAAGFV